MRGRWVMGFGVGEVGCVGGGGMERWEREGGGRLGGWVGG